MKVITQKYISTFKVLLNNRTIYDPKEERIEKIELTTYARYSPFAREI